MSPFRCSCGFTTGQAAEYTDHLEEAFIPDDDRDPRGQVHAEATPQHVRAAGVPDGTALCLCGFTAGTMDLDDHFLLVFTPADGIGLDRLRHILLTTSTPGHKQVT